SAAGTLQLRGGCAGGAGDLADSESVTGQVNILLRFLLWEALATFHEDFTGQLTQLVALQLRAGAIALAKFEECLQRLEKIVQELEKGDVPLEKSLTLFEEGMQLSTACRKELEDAEGKVEILLKQNGKLQANPFEHLIERAPVKK